MINYMVAGPDVMLLLLLFGTIVTLLTLTDLPFIQFTDVISVTCIIAWLWVKYKYKDYDIDMMV